MKPFQCGRCGHLVFFENTVCESCDAKLGFFSPQADMIALTCEDLVCRDAVHPDKTYRYCRNHEHGVCNWLVADGDASAFCAACKLNRTIPDLSLLDNLRAWGELEAAKHRLVYSLIKFGLPLQSKSEDAERGLAFDFLADDGPDPTVTTGHRNGLITIQLAEADSVHREQTRRQLREPYRTPIGHFRHEVGHYFWERLVAAHGNTLARFRTAFGDERSDYQEALQRYYQSGPPDDWRERCISAYASSHPWEEWAETWAHYFHMIDALETAFAFGLRGRPAAAMGGIHFSVPADPYAMTDINELTGIFVPLSIAVNSLNRSMGHPDLYPFVMPDPVVDKLAFVHTLIKAQGIDRPVEVQP